MKSSNIGGQAVMEGVMMKNGAKYAVAVRKTDGEINVEVFDDHDDNEMVKKIPIIRGVYAFITSLLIGMKTLMYSASFFEEDEEPKDEDDRNENVKEQGEFKEKAVMVSTMMISVLLAVLLFVILPYGLAYLFRQFITSITWLSVVEGIFRLGIFLLYVVLISHMKDIQRVFMYHGAEHKCINCIEHGFELNIENVRKSSRLHKRCGTSFLLIVMVVSIVFFAFIHIELPLLRLASRIILIPVVAGVSYEFLKFAGRSENKIVDFLSKPGLLLQKMTTSEPDDEMIEVGIASVEAVFDWKSFLAGEEQE